MFQPGSSTQYQSAPSSSGSGSKLSSIPILGQALGPATTKGSSTSSKVEGGVNTGLNVGAMIPGPQQPFVAAAAMLAPFFEKLF